MAGVQYGVAKKANLFGGKVLGDNGSGSYAGIIAGVDLVNAAPSTRTKIANMSLGGGLSTALNDAVTSATDVVHVVASGNSNANACNFSPASAEGAYTVNAMQQGDSRSSFSNFGTCTDIFAPGSSIQAAWSTSDTATNTISGTSMAAPHVAGIAALLVSDSASLTMQQVKDAMTGLATPNAISNAGAGSPNLLAYNDRDGPSTPAPPTVPPTPAPPTPAPACSCTGNWENVADCEWCQSTCGMFGSASFLIFVASLIQEALHLFHHSSFFPKMSRSLKPILLQIFSYAGFLFANGRLEHAIAQLVLLRRNSKTMSSGKLSSKGHNKLTVFAHPFAFNSATIAFV
jgi:hypothetical protein